MAWFALIAALAFGMFHGFVGLPHLASADASRARAGSRDIHGAGVERLATRCIRRGSA